MTDAPLPTPPAAVAADDERLRREKEFHDRIFADDTRAGTGRFYAVAGASGRCYESLLAARAGGARALEYGCGPGSHSGFLAARGAQVVGIDLSDTAIQQAGAAAAAGGFEATFRRMNAERLDFPEGSFDLVCGTAILHHLDLDRAYAEVRRVLAPGGSAVFREPLGHNPLINRYRGRTPHLRTPDEHPLLLADLERARAHFGRVDLRFFHLLSLAAVPLAGTRAGGITVQVLDAADRALFAAVPAVRRQAWQVVMTLTS